MLEGKFSVYNNNGGSEPPSAEIKKPSPINFKYEWCQTATLSFDDELRMAMDKFHQSKQPSPVKVAVKKWLADHTPKSLKIKPKEQTAVQIKPKAEPIEFKTPKFVKDFGQKMSKMFEFDIDIKLPEFPKINLPKVAVQKMATQIERKFDAIDQPLMDGYEKTKELLKKLQEKAKDLYEEIVDKIPFDKIQEVWNVIQEIPQQYIIPPALWIASFIPAEKIRLSFLSGMRRISYAAHKAFGFANRSYKFAARQIKKGASYLNKRFVQPLALGLGRFFKWLFKVFTDLAKWLYPILKRGLIRLYHFACKSPKMTWDLLKRIWKGLCRLTIRIVTALAE